MVPEPWEVVVDAEGSSYYFNPATEETSWELPEAAAKATGGGEQPGSEADAAVLPGGWEVVTDDEGAVYYHCVATGEVSWDLPEAAASDALPEDWEEVEDGQGSTYYFNPVTNETSWNHPGAATEGVVANKAKAGSVPAGMRNMSQLALLPAKTIAPHVRQFSQRQ